MTVSSLPTLSLVIPAHNEEDSIGFVLRSLREQKDEFLEIIVVDNNCSDGTVALVETFFAEFPTLRVLKEWTPGVVAARNAGFDAAEGDVIARLDADTRAHPGWARVIRTFFADVAEGKVDGAIVTCTGRFDQYDMPMPWLHSFMSGIAFRNLHNEPVDVPSLFGANMAITKLGWERIRPKLLTRNGILDDLDITLCVQDAELRAVAIPGMEVSASGRRLLSSVADYKTFTGYMPATFYARGEDDRAEAAKWPVRVMRAMHLVLWVPVRAWDPIKQRYSVRRLCTPAAARALPYPDDELD